MNYTSPKKHHLIILIGILLLSGVIAGGYFLYLKPINDKLDRKETELEMANQQLTIIENKTVGTDEQTAESTMKLQKLVPVKRQLDQLILDIEKAEVISNVTIDEISMNGTDSDESIEIEQNTEQANQSETEGTEVKTDNVNQSEEADTEDTEKASDETNDGTSETTDESSTNEESVETIEVPLPNGMNRTSITIKGKAENYFELEKFIDSLLSLNRIIVIDNLSFKGREEIRNVDQVEEKTEFELAMSAFYYPKLEDLLNELPPMDTPETANKKNPLNSFSTDAKND